MNLTIDPDLLYSSVNGNQCSELLLIVERNEAKVRFIENYFLKEKYSDFLATHKKDQTRSIARSIALRIIKSKLTTRIKDPSKLCRELEELIDQNQCDEVECYLWRLASVLSKTKFQPQLLVLMSGTIWGTEKRCIYNIAIKDLVKKHLPNIHLVFADRIADFNHFLNKPDNTVELNSRLFELQIESIITKTYNYISESNDIYGEQIDLHCIRNNVNKRLILVGECKLRFGEITEQPITREEIKQLTRKIDAAKAFERKRNDLSQDIEIKGFIISNAVELNPDARELVKEYQTSIHFVNVTMPKNWVNNPKWKINFANLHFDPPLDPPT